MAFDSEGPAGDPIRIKLPEKLDLPLVVYVSSGAKGFASRIHAWIEAHAGEALRARLHRWLRTNRLEITAHEKGCVQLPPIADCVLQRTDRAALRRVEAAGLCLLVRASPEYHEPRERFWALVASGRALSAAFAGAVFDLALRGYWPTSLENQDLPADGSIAVSEHVRVLHSVDERGLAWFTTVGLPAFGLPNLELRNAPPDRASRLGSLLFAVAQVLVDAALGCAHGRGRAPRELRIGPEIRITYADTARASRTGEEGDPEKAGLVRLEYSGRGRARLEPFIELLPPRGFERSTGAWLSQVLDVIAPEEDRLIQYEGVHGELEAAHRRAVRELGGVKERFQRGLPVGSRLRIKHGFKSEHGVEYMWVAVATWKGTRIQGHLANKPAYCPDLRSGDPVELSETEVYDWLIEREDGSREGAYTDRVLEKEL